MKAPSETSYLSSFIPPLGPLWVLLMGLQRCIIYVTASDTSPLDQNLGPRHRISTSSLTRLYLSPSLPLSLSLNLSLCLSLFLSTNAQRCLEIKRHGQ